MRGDGVTAKTRPHADRTYLTALDLLQAIFEKRPFLLGAVPTIADFGMMGPMLRHFSQDPTPSEIMRDRAPAVYEWVARMWNSKESVGGAELIDGLDDPLRQLLAEICDTHIAQLRQNAEGVLSRTFALRPNDPGFRLPRGANVSVPRLVPRRTAARVAPVEWR